MTLEEALRAPTGLESLDDWCADEVRETLMDPKLDPKYRTGRMDGLNSVRRRLAGKDGNGR